MALRVCRSIQYWYNSQSCAVYGTVRRPEVPVLEDMNIRVVMGKAATSHFFNFTIDSIKN